MITELTKQQKLDALAARFYQGVIWTPKAGDYYTSSRADLELYRVVKIENGLVYTEYCKSPGILSEWAESGFTSEGFGKCRVHVQPWILKCQAQEIESLANQEKDAEIERLKCAHSNMAEMYRKSQERVTYLEDRLEKAQANQTKCEGCNGHGLVGNILETDTCPFCKGSGVQSSQSQVSDVENKITKAAYMLARRALWVAYVWNDHNFESAYKYARETAKEFGINSFEDANDWLDKADALCLQSIPATKGGE